MTGTKLWERYQAGLQYQRQMGFPESFPEYVRFKEGDQWPKPTKATRHLPRPVFNLIEYFIRTKRSNVYNTTVKMVFSPAEESDERTEEAATAYTNYASCLWEELEQDALNEEFLDDAATLGTGVLHYYWDSGESGGSRYPYQGSLRGEIIDPLAIFFGNPQVWEVQKQPDILIASRATVESVRQTAKGLGLKPEEVELIQPDEAEAGEYPAEEAKELLHQKCTLLTRYYKDGGEVKFDRGTRTAVLQEGVPLTPEGAQERITRYPVVVMPWVRRKKCIYGIGEAAGMIPTQKAVNWLMGMNILSAQDLAWPKMIAKEGALRQEITNAPGEIIVDHNVGGPGLSYLNPPAFSGFAVNLVDKVTDLLRQTSGVSEVSTGEPFTSTMAASAIIALQNQAKQPIQSIQRRFFGAMKQVGKIWEEFFRCYYTLPRPMRYHNSLGQEESGVFLGSQYADIPLALSVDVGAASEYSESLAQATLDKLFDGGHIPLSAYIELAPQNVMPFKEQLKRLLEEQQTQQGMEPPMNSGLPEAEGQPPAGNLPQVREGVVNRAVPLL